MMLDLLQCMQRWAGSVVTLYVHGSGRVYMYDAISKTLLHHCGVVCGLQNFSKIKTKWKLNEYWMIVGEAVDWMNRFTDCICYLTLLFVGCLYIAYSAHTHRAVSIEFTVFIYIIFVCIKPL